MFDKNEQDSHTFISDEDMTNLVILQGFELLSNTKHSMPNKYNESIIDSSEFKCFWHPSEHILLKFETSSKLRGSKENLESYIGINSAEMRYTIKPKNRQTFYMEVAGSGHYREDLWIGNHNIQEGFVRKLNKLRKYGTFKPWKYKGGQILYLKPYVLRDFFQEKYTRLEIMKDWPDDIKSEILNGEKYVPSSYYTSSYDTSSYKIGEWADKAAKYYRKKLKKG